MIFFGYFRLALHMNFVDTRVLTTVRTVQPTRNNKVRRKSGKRSIFKVKTISEVKGYAT